MKSSREPIPAGMWNAVCGIICLCLLVFYLAWLRGSVHHDVWHQMALARETIRLGYVPQQDLFSYAKAATVFPSVQHEWGAGVLAYTAVTLAGGSGLVALNYVLAVALAAVCALFLWREKARLPIAAIAVPIVILQVVSVFMPVVAQAYSLLMFAALMWFLTLDRTGDRRWIWAWLPLFVLWVNLHGGIVVGTGAVALHCIERAWRRERFGHLLWVLAAMMAAIVANPYGPALYSYLVRAVLMPRPFITEWDPKWLFGSIGPHSVGFLLSLPLLAYVLLQLGPRSVPGFFLTTVLAAASARTLKLVPLYAIAWLFTVVKPLGETVIGMRWDAFFRRRAQAVSMAGIAVFPVLVIGVWNGKAWRPVVTGNPGPDHMNCYPVGPADYLEAHKIRANLLTDFEHGAYVSWRLYPRIKVGCDSRYEVAYSRAWVEQVVRLYKRDSDPGWKDVIASYPTDLVLAPAGHPLVKKLSSAGWRQVYVDDGFELFARPGLDLAHQDRKGQRILGTGL